MKVTALKDSIENRRIEWQRHSLERMMERNISRRAVIDVLLNGEAIEDYPHDQPFPSALFLGWVGQRPIHVVISYDSSDKRVYIITAYEPSLEHFEAGFKIRRKR
jgi:hypothetical protein